MTNYDIRLTVKRNSRIEPIQGPGLIWLLIILLLLASAGAVGILADNESADGSDPLTSFTPLSETTREARIYTVTYKSAVFSPTNLRIHEGDTVRFKNDGFFAIHIIGDKTAQLDGFDSVGDIPQGSIFSFTFAKKGTFGYYNSKSPQERGTIIVR